MTKLCPIVKEECWQEKCQWYHPIVFTDEKQHSEVKNACVANWIPLLLIENAKETRHAAASTDKVANEINAGASTILLRALGARLPNLERD